jgi:arsenate reductase
MLTIYHNGECNKSKGALELLQEHNIPHHVRWYMAEPFDEAELVSLLKKLGMPASAVARAIEPLYKEQYEGKNISEEEWVGILLANPILIQRPIVENGDKAIIARPPERVLEMV